MQNLQPNQDPAPLPPPSDILKELSTPRTRNLYNPSPEKPFRLSRSKIDLFVRCARCFYLDRRCGVTSPPSPPFSLNSAVDTLLKNEFDIYRKEQKPHPLMTEAGISAIPFQHPDLEAWRDTLRRGIIYFLPKTNLIITGSVDDVWINPRGELHVVDYKATSKMGEVSLDAEWQKAYKRQVEVYQWLLRKNDFTVSDTAYFVYCNGKKDRLSFEGRLEFSQTILSHTGNADWVEPTLLKIYHTLQNPHVPNPSTTCEHCAYRAQAAAVERWSR